MKKVQATILNIHMQKYQNLPSKENQLNLKFSKQSWRKM